MKADSLPEAADLVQALDGATESWHSVAPTSATTPGPSIHAIILALHRANFDLWHEEDQARDPDATDARIANVKRAIDKLNQRRNDLVEAADQTLSEIQQDETSPLHSETPAMMIDRLSIMSLKIYHTREETLRAETTEAHREKNRRRLAVLTDQRRDLAACLDTLMAQIARGERRFKLYRQMKMYNDPDLNPVLYRRAGG